MIDAEWICATMKLAGERCQLKGKVLKKEQYFKCNKKELNLYYFLIKTVKITAFKIILRLKNVKQKLSKFKTFKLKMLNFDNLIRKELKLYHF